MVLVVPATFTEVAVIIKVLAVIAGNGDGALAYGIKNAGAAVTVTAQK